MPVNPPKAVRIRTGEGWQDIALVGPQGPAGPPGQAGTGANYVYYQLLPASSWVVTHPLSKYPAIMVVDTGDTVVIPDIHYDSQSQVTISFGSPTSGRAFLN